MKKLSIITCLFFMSAANAATLLELNTVFSNRGATILALTGDLDRANKAMALSDEVVNGVAALPITLSNAEKYQALILSSSASLLKGTVISSAEKEAKRSAYMAGVLTAKQAIDLGKQTNQDYADAYYFAGANMGRWAEATGVMESLTRKQELMNYMQWAKERSTMNGKPGRSVESYGPDRILGRMYFRLPGFAGGSLPLSLQSLKISFDEGYVLPLDGEKYALNAIFYADSLYKSGKDKAVQADMDKAKSILDELLSLEEANYGDISSERTFEMVWEEIPLAKSLRAQMN